MQAKVPLFLNLLDFVEGEVDRRVAAEDRNVDVQAALVVVDGVDATRKVLERARLDADLFADFELDLGTGLRRRSRPRS